MMHGRDLNLCKLAGMLRLRSAEFARLQLGLLGMAESQGWEWQRVRDHWCEAASVRRAVTPMIPDPPAATPVLPEFGLSMPSLTLPAR